MNSPIAQKKTIVRGERLHPAVRSELVRMIDSGGIQPVADMVRAIMVQSGMNPIRHTCPLVMLRRVQSDEGGRFAGHWKIILESCAKRRGRVIEVQTSDCGESVVEVQTAEPTELVRGQGTTSVVFNGQEVRIAVGEDGEPVFVAKDLVEAVGAEWKGASGSLGHIPAEYRGVCSVQTPSGTQQMVILTEAGMNMYLFRSDKPAAMPWQRHLAEVILPEIRKTGRYEAPGNPKLPPPAVDYQALGTVVAAAVAGVLLPAMREMLPRRRTRVTEPNPSQTVIPQTQEQPTIATVLPTEQPNPNTLALLKLRNNPRLRGLPKPHEIRDGHIADGIKRMVHVYAKESGLTHEVAYNTAYDRISLEMHWNLDERGSGETVIRYIGSQPPKRQREAYKWAYAALVTPHVS